MMDLVLSGICLKDGNGRFTTILRASPATRLSQWGYSALAADERMPILTWSLEEAP
jgi:hypothetical protein